MKIHLVALITCLIFSIPSFAQEGVSHLRYPPDGKFQVIRSPRTSAQTPASTKVITSQEMNDQEQAKTLPDTLKQVPGIMVQKTSHGQASPFIRGFTGFRTLLLVDGIRLNNSVFREGPNQYFGTVDQLSLSRLEIIKGPGSVLYGSDAIGGTVNAVTKSDADFSADAPFGTYYRYASAENSHIGHLETGAALGEKFGIYAGLSYKDYGDLWGGKDIGEQPKTAYSDYGGDLKLRYHLASNMQLTALYQNVNQDDVWRTHSTVYAKSFKGSAVGGDLRRVLDQKRELIYLKYEGQDVASWIRDISLTLSRHKQQEDEDRLKPTGATPGEKQGFDVSTLGVGLQVRSPSSIGEWTYGSSFYRDSVSTDKQVLDTSGIVTLNDIQGPVADDANYDLADAFVQHELNLSDHWDLISGAHVTYAAANARKVKNASTGAQFSVKDSWSAPVFWLRGLYGLNETKSTSLYVGAAQAVRAPNLSDLTRFDINRSNEIETPAPGLSPEKYISLEIGAKTNEETLRGEVGYFYTFIDSMIVRQPTGVTISGKQEVTKANSGNGFVHGIEVDGEMDLSLTWGLITKLTIQEGFVKSYPTSSNVQSTEWLSRLSPFVITLGAYHRIGDMIRIETAVTKAEKQDQLTAADKLDTQRIPPGGTPGYTIWSLKANWSPSQQVSVTGGIENITDESYRIHGSGVIEAGRNFVVSASFRF